MPAIDAVDRTVAELPLRARHHHLFALLIVGIGGDQDRRQLPSSQQPRYTDDAVFVHSVCVALGLQRSSQRNARSRCFLWDQRPMAFIAVAARFPFPQALQAGPQCTNGQAFRRPEPGIRLTVGAIASRKPG